MMDCIIGLCGPIKVKNPEDGLWYRRFCVLQSRTFTIYRDDTLVDIETVVRIDPTVQTKEISKSKTPRFSLSTSNGELLISVETHEELNKILTSIETSRQQPPSLTMDNFNIISVIGRGYYGKVMLVQHKTTGELYALKTIQKKRLIESRKSHTVIAERNSLMKAHHPFIVRLCFAFQTPQKFYLGLEYASGGELFYHMDRVGALPIDQVRLYVAEIALALSYLHSLGIVYRDLKPENVMLDSEGHVKLTDFGLAKEIFQENYTSTLCGTTEYLSPEMVLRNQYDYGVDWWALGVLMFEMLTEETPFANANRSKMLHDIVHTPPLFPPYIPPDAVELMSALLSKDSKDRPGIEEIKKFKFFETINFDVVYNRGYTPSFVPEQTAAPVPVNFDPEFTCEKAADSPASPFVADFPGFSYTACSLGEDVDLGTSPIVQ